MATIAAPVRGDQRVVFHDVAWETYIGLVKARHEGLVRLTYHRGVLEVMTLSQLHERLSRLLHRFVVEITQELGLELASVGATTMHAEQLQVGGQADESYYIRHEEIVREREEYDPAIDPPPDLVVEVDLSSSSSRRMLVYARMLWPTSSANGCANRSARGNKLLPAHLSHNSHASQPEFSRILPPQRSTYPFFVFSSISFSVWRAAAAAAVNDLTCV
jgi:Uma2 family endonuclease